MGVGIGVGFGTGVGLDAGCGVGIDAGCGVGIDAGCGVGILFALTTKPYIHYHHSSAFVRWLALSENARRNNDCTVFGSILNLLWRSGYPSILY